MNGTNGHAAASALTPAVALATTTNADTTKHSSAPDVYRAICEVAREISRDGISKNGKNQQQGYSFRGIDDIYNALSALLAGAELCILPRMSARTQEERATAGGKALFYVTVQGDFDFVSARDGSRHTITMYGEAMDSADKATNKAMSAAYKYACMQVFCIPTEGMADADSTTPQPAGKKPPAPRPAAELRAAADIDTGGHPIGTQAASDYVAQQKLAGKAPAPSKPAEPARPWRTLAEAKRIVTQLREKVGETAFLREMAKYRFRTVDDFDPRKPEAVLELYHSLMFILDGEAV